MKTNTISPSVKIFIFVGCLFVLGLQSIHGQNQGQNLRQDFYTASNDSLKLKAFDKLYMYNIVRDLDQSAKLLAIGDSLCQVLKSASCDAFLNLFYGFYHRKAGTYEESISFLKKAHELFVETGNESKQGVCLFNIGVVTSYLGDYDGAVSYYLKALEVYKKVGNVNGQINVNNSLGIIYKNLDLFDKSKEYYLKAEQAALENENKPMLAMINNNIANLFYQQIEFPDSVIHYGEKALNLEIELDRNTGIASAHNLIGAAYIDKKDKKNALYHTEKAVDYSNKSQVQRFIAIHELGLADTYAKFDEYDKAFKHYESALEIHDSLGLLTHQVAGYRGYADALAKGGNFQKAYEIRKVYENHRDSLDVEQRKTDIAELEKKYETALKDQEIKEQELEINRKTYQRNLYSGGLVLSLLLGGSVIWGLNNRTKKNRKLAQQAQFLKDQEIQALQQEKKLLSMVSMIEGQENERIRIAKDLHDGLGGLLTNVKAHFGKIQSEIETLENLDIYSSASQMIDKAHDEVRRISHNLMPADLRAGGLPVAVRQLVHELRTIHGIITDFELVGLGDERIDDNLELTIFRIIQELVNNIVKYANASHVLIQLSKFKKDIQIVVEDDGKGFNYSEALNSEGIGLKSITSRVDHLKGQIDVASSPEKGSSFTINIPLK